MKSAPSQDLRWIRPPRQERSRKTLDRILDAAEALLADRTCDELAIADVVRRGRTSVGAFYARFANKDALIHALYDRHQQEAVATMEDTFSPDRWRGRPVQEIVTQHVRFIIRLYREKRGLMRALVLHGFLNPDWRYQDQDARGKLSLSRIAALLGERRDEINHPNPRLAASMGLLMVLAAAREKILFGESTASALDVSDRKLETELTRAYLAYLEVSPKGGRAARPKKNRSTGA